VENELYQSAVSETPFLSYNKAAGKNKSDFNEEFDGISSRTPVMVSGMLSKIVTVLPNAGVFPNNCNFMDEEITTECLCLRGISGLPSRSLN